MFSGDFIFNVIPHLAAGVHDGTWDVMDSRNKSVVANFATQPLAAADAISRNRTVAGLS